MVGTCDPQFPVRMDALHQQVGQLDMRVHNVEVQLREEIKRSTKTTEEFREAMCSLTQTIANKNDIKDFFADNWKYIGVLVILMTGGDVTAFIQAAAQMAKVAG